MKQTSHTNALVALAIVALAATFPMDASAQAVFAAPTSFLTSIQTFINGAGGILLGGVIIAAAAIAAASPRANFNWGQFFIILVVVSVFFGAFKIAETLQAVSA